MSNLRKCVIFLFMVQIFLPIGLYLSTRELRETLALHYPYQHAFVPNKIWFGNESKHWHEITNFSLALRKSDCIVNEQTGQYIIPCGNKFELPEEFLWDESEEFESVMFGKTCAVVGNSGILLDSGYGEEIDEHDFVIRFSDGAYYYPEHVHDIGEKVTVQTANPSRIRTDYSLYQEDRENNYIRAEYYLWNSYRCDKNPSQMKVHSLMGNQTKFIIKSYLWNLEVLPNYQKLVGLNGKEMVLTTGSEFVLNLIPHCKSITVYGTWPFNNDCYGKAMKYHFHHKDVVPITENPNYKNHHDFEKDMEMLLSLEEKHDFVEIRFPSKGQCIRKHATMEEVRNNYPVN